MHIFDKSKTPQPVFTPHGEAIYEIIGREVGETTSNHSVAHVEISKGKSSLRHYHPEAEESYYILAGQGRIEIGEEMAELKVGDVVLIPPPQPHKIFNTGDDSLVFLAVCVPAWEPTNTVWIEQPLPAT